MAFSFVQKLVLKKVTTPKKPSHEASVRTVCRRNADINQFISDISSPVIDDEEATIHQLAAFLKGKTKEELTKVNLLLLIIHCVWDSDKELRGGDSLDFEQCNNIYILSFLFKWGSIAISRCSHTHILLTG